MDVFCLLKLHHPSLLPYARGHERWTPIPAEITLFLADEVAVGKLELDLHVGRPGGLVGAGSDGFCRYGDGGEVDAEFWTLVGTRVGGRIEKT